MSACKSIRVAAYPTFSTGSHALFPNTSMNKFQDSSSLPTSKCWSSLIHQHKIHPLGSAFSSRNASLNPFPPFAGAKGGEGLSVRTYQGGKTVTQFLVIEALSAVRKGVTQTTRRTIHLTSRNWVDIRCVYYNELSVDLVRCAGDYSIEWKSKFKLKGCL